MDELGLVAQLVERCLCKAEALGSNPSKSTHMHHLRMTRMGRAEAPSPQRAAVEAVHKFCDQTLTEFSEE